MSYFPESAYIVLITGLVTIFTSIVTQIFVSRNESKKAAREEAREAQKHRLEWQSKQREIKFSKLAELWLAVDLSRERLVDAGIQSEVGDQILPPPSKDMAAKATSAAYGIALIHFPEMRPLAYALHVETVKYEAALWFHQTEDTDKSLDRLTNTRTELADAVEKAASDLQQHHI